MAKKKIKIVTMGELLVELGDAPDRYAKAIAKVYSENEVIATHEVKGNTIFVCEG